MREVQLFHLSKTTSVPAGGSWSPSATCRRTDAARQENPAALKKLYLFLCACPGPRQAGTLRGTLINHGVFTRARRRNTPASRAKVTPRSPRPLGQVVDGGQRARALLFQLLSHLEVLDVDARPAGHGEEAGEVRMVKEDVDGHAPQRGRDDLFENVHVGEDVHRKGDNLGACERFENHLNNEETILFIIVYFIYNSLKIKTLNITLNLRYM